MVISVVVVATLVFANGWLVSPASVQSAVSPAVTSSVGIVAGLRRQAASGDANAQVALGKELMRSKRSSDHAEAVRWYRKAAGHGSADADWQLGSAYLVGLGVPRDVGKALMWLRKSLSKDESADHMADFGLLTIQHGLSDGDTQAVQQGARWVRRGARAGSAGGMEVLAQILLTGTMGLPQNKPGAEHWLLEATHLGDANAAAILGKLYVTGFLGPGKTKAGLHWLQVAMRHGRVNAEGMLAVLLISGQYHVAKDPAKGIKLAHEAAAKDNSLGYYALGLAYASGTGTPINAALAWYNFAVAARLNTDHQLTHIREDMARAAAKLSKSQIDDLRSRVSKIPVAKRK